MERESRLYKSLLDTLEDRESANIIYAIANIPKIANKLNLEYEENSEEPTFESLNRALNIGEFLKGNISIAGIKLTEGLVNTKGDLNVFEDINEAVNKAIEVNEKHDNTVADIIKTDKGYAVNLETKDISNIDKPAQLVFNNTLNNHLLDILHNLGFDAGIDNDIEHGVFDPTNAVKTAEGLIRIIRIAKGNIGEEAFPEEFSHAILEGLSANNLVIRLMNSLNDQAIEDILGEDYDVYYEKYEGNFNKLRKEAAGKLLASHIKGTPIQMNNKPSSLLGRIWSLIKGIFSKSSVSEIEDAINEASEAASKISNMILNDNITPLVNKENIINGDTLYHVTASISKDQELAQKAVETLSKRMNLTRIRSKERKYSDEELKTIREINELISEKKYAASCYAFLQDGIEKIISYNNTIKRLKEGTADDSDLSRLRIMSITLRNIKEFTDGYTSIVNDLRRAPFLQEDGVLEMSESDAQRIQEQAEKLSSVINNINTNYEELRFNTVKNYLKIFWGEDKIIEMGKSKGGLITLDMILKMADKDIGGADRWINSLSDSSDMLSNTIAKAVRVSQSKRDSMIRTAIAEIRQIHKDLNGDTSFMYERDANGKLTGRIISDRNITKYLEDRRAFITELKDKEPDKYKRKIALEKWERENTDEVILDSESERTEQLPSMAKYGAPEVLNKLTTAQRKYYDAMMNYKIAMDKLLPNRYSRIYNAVQIRNDITEAIGNNLSNPKAAAKLALDNLKDNFLRREDDTDFGEGTSKVLLDFSGKEVNKLPVYYTRKLKDTERLSTDFTSSLIAYAGMAINYNEMNKVIDVLELTRDLVHDREITQRKGDSALEESYRVMGQFYKKIYTKKGESSALGARVDDFYEMVLYNKMKKDQGSIHIPGAKYSADTAKTMDAIKDYSGLIGLGLNLFSGISNITVGKMQIFIDAMSGEFFGFKNSQIGKKNYYAMLPRYLSELAAPVKTNKLSLLIDRFDALEEFNNNIAHNKLYQGALGRIMGNTSMYIFNNLGEHYLHCRTMLAILDRYKVVQKKEDGSTKKMSLFDALEVKEIKDNKGELVRTELALKDGIIKEDGTEFTEDDFIFLKNKIGRVNESLNGAFNNADKGAIHRYALGRMAMQFRQWMPAHYKRRFGNAYYDTLLDQWREGYYRTTGRFVGNLISDLKKAKFQIGTRWNELSPHEKANLKRALTEISTFASLAAAIAAIGPAKDHKGKWTERMAIYNLKRMYLETGAAVPWFSFFDNMFTIIKSPAAALNTVDNIIDILNITNMMAEKTSGRYKGWSEWEVSASKNLPAYGQISKIFDVADEDYMFTIFNDL